MFFLLSVVLFAAGIASFSQPKQTNGKLLDDSSGPSSRAWLLAAALATIAILLFVWIAKTFAKPPNPTLRTSELMIVVPFLLALGAILVQRNWQRLTSWRTTFLDNRFVIGDQALVLILAVVPFLALSVLSLVKPIFNARGLLPLAPYLLLVLSAGIVRIARHPDPGCSFISCSGHCSLFGIERLQPRLRRQSGLQDLRGGFSASSGMYGPGFSSS